MNDPDLDQIKSCRLTLHSHVSGELDLLRGISSLGFKIAKVDPVIVECECPSVTQLQKLCCLIQEHDRAKVSERSQDKQGENKSESKFRESDGIEEESSNHQYEQVEHGVPIDGKYIEEQEIVNRSDITVKVNEVETLSSSFTFVNSNMTVPDPSSSILKNGHNNEGQSSQMLTTDMQKEENENDEKNNILVCGYMCPQSQGNENDDKLCETMSCNQKKLLPDSSRQESKEHDKCNEEQEFSKGHQDDEEQQTKVMSVVDALQDTANQGDGTRTNSVLTAFYSVDAIHLAVENGKVMDFEADLIITLGEMAPALLMKASDFVGHSNTVPKQDEQVRGSNDKTIFWRLSSSDRKVKSPIICSLTMGSGSDLEVQEAFRNLLKVPLKSIDPSMTVISITSPLLYLENGNEADKVLPKRKRSKLLSDLVKVVQLLLHTESLDQESSLQHVTIVGSEEVLPHVIKILDSLAADGKGVTKHPVNNPSNDNNEHVQTDENDVSQINQSHNLSMQAGIQDATVANKWETEQTDELLARYLATDHDLQCVICDRGPIRLVKQQCCKSLLCQSCRQSFCVCPFCLTSRGIIYGNQPNGRMHCAMSETSVDGHPNCGSYKIIYEFEDGIQSREHPHPGQRYNRAKRVAYLPASEFGTDVLYLLRLAFLRGLTFTVGQSMTSGKEDVIVWTGIEHKTNRSGGKTCYGYPDEDYLLSVKIHLKQMGVSYESITEQERNSLKLYFSELFKNNAVFEDATGTVNEQHSKTT